MGYVRLSSAASRQLVPPTSPIIWYLSTPFLIPLYPAAVELDVIEEVVLRRGIYHVENTGPYRRSGYGPDREIPRYCLPLVALSPGYRPQLYRSPPNVFEFESDVVLFCIHTRMLTWPLFLYNPSR